MPGKTQSGTAAASATRDGAGDAAAQAAAALRGLPKVTARVAAELGVAESRVAAAVALLDDGATVPFIARYRKEATEGLDDTELRRLDERLRYLRELDERRAVVLESIASQGKLTAALQDAIVAADTKSRLEDIYLPYKPKRRTKAQIAREAGLGPLAELLLTEPGNDPDTAAAQYVDAGKGVDDAAAALAGARAILVERFAEDADLVGELRETMWGRGRLTTAVREGKETSGAKFSDYFEFSEPFTTLPSHRILAVFRGEKEEILRVTLDPEPGETETAAGPASVYETAIAARFGIAGRGRAADGWLADTVRWAWRTKLMLSLGIDLRLRLRQNAETAAVDVFAQNLKDLLLAAPAGNHATMGLDPGFRTGVKVAVVDGTGKLLATSTIYPHPPQRRYDAAIATLAALVEKHGVQLIAIGNGTASRETDALAAELLTAMRGRTGDAALRKVVVSEAGASVYSASEYAAREFPDLDVSLRGAVSIARRLQDPLAELVKIEPKSIGVGQYQHDVSETKLARSLAAVVEDAVNAVGVDVNTASVPLLRRVSGIAGTLAENIVAHREANGPFSTRKEILDVARLGPKAFEQCAGFLRIPAGTDPLDASAVHPEAYPVVRRILEATGHDVPGLMGRSELLRGLRPQEFADERFGVPTVTDILAELEKPGRDPRPEFVTATFADGVEKLTDLRPGMVLEGVVTNVAAFGAFVDVGVHQDGLVHVSAMSDRFVSDPHEVVSSGQVVKVKVLDVDEQRSRISLTLRLDDEAGTRGGGRADGPRAGGRGAGNKAAGQKAAGRKGAGNSGAQGGTGGRGSGGSGGRGKRPSGGGNGRGNAGGAMADALRRAGLH
ncbi:RNA-binding transcriptional accessory protein [Tomitella fengzijianii]|uniref:RNA-binding transcriptional accessory protein n=2 Tax=Tomitella fengzijianii TaxID=2597660 RepID=A0A516X9A0_9ACTN|nr:RNA-binding transcriptional accessory protein [Tomitella fengzijianii]